MAVFPLLADPSGYRACDSDLLIDVQARQYWLDLFEKHFAVQLDAARSIGTSKEVCEHAYAAFRGELHDLATDPGRYGHLDILLLDELRQRVLEERGIRDEFRSIKSRENEAAFADLPHWLDQIDAAGPDTRLELIVRGMLAGNLFDMGVQETARRFVSDDVRFANMLAAVPKRPWLVDHVDEATNWYRSQSSGSKAIIFADNAGGDVVLGVLPLAREMLQRGWEVVLTANSAASLNDVTHQELLGHVVRASMIDPIWADPALRLVESGNASPLIDLARVSHELADAAVGASLIVLVGMGRGIESNLTARFTCQAWHVAMLKDPQVARAVNGRLYDAVFLQKCPSSLETASTRVTRTTASASPRP